MIKDMQRLQEDGDYFRKRLGKDRGFLVTFDLITGESAKDGDTADGGFSDYHSCEPDEFDEGKTAVDLAVEYLRDKCVEPSSSHFHDGVWYSDCDPDRDYRTGDETYSAYHPTSFTVDEQRAIFNAVCR